MKRAISERDRAGIGARIAASLATMATACSPQARQPELQLHIAPAGRIETSITGKSSYFAGEPIYLQMALRNTEATPQIITGYYVMLEDSDVVIRDSAGQQVPQIVSVVDGARSVAPRDTLMPGQSLDWVNPIHWYHGSRRDTILTWENFAFDPGRYRVRLVFPSAMGLPEAAFDLVIRQPSDGEERALRVFHDGARAVLLKARRTGSIDSVLPDIMALERDSTQGPFRVTILCELAGIAGVFAHQNDSHYRVGLDSVIRNRAVAASGPEQTRLLQCIPKDRFAALVQSDAALTVIPFTRQRLRRVH